MFTKWWMGSLFKRGAAVVLSLSLLTAGGCGLLPKEEEEEQLPAITPPTISKKPEYDVTTATLETKVSSVGKVISMQEETLYFTLDGKRLKELYVKNGQDVKAGDPIGELDVDDLRKELRTKKLDFRRQETKMKETLRNKDDMDPVDYEEAVIVFEEGRQALADLQEEIDKAVLTAPFSGKIVSLNVQKGDEIKAYDAICIVADTSQLTAAAKLSKDQLTKVALGMEVVADINGIGEVKGVVKQLPLQSTDNDQNGQNGQQTLERPEDFLIVQLSKMPEGLQRGTPLSLNIIVNRKKDAIVIPLSALRSIGARQYVQVVEADGSKREVDVEVGQQTSTQAEILKGLTPGQKVVGR
ncbi:macrolide-specific efflux system membrane fusion protein [Paenibacillus cellulosilyticus]|uniref:Macrolide-specific efflux system membrane fusion protein n=1 Tax=Paenibacillus cellulosilyticus TaxID=375489 RepID=A0A2V2Y9P6_9BACL|nr:efflux RND transporter periplasmic adaptor subunit [Paenibacillus cellulosilyticus]PWV87837.1 macrolide-specific efflux system membrane fusion protein [Paenibacillus cellulosilyticus]QKS43125.1 efflux RND transporter periplasmic adaptor subunit [Paenibacillus cellulosilyticus]